MNVDILSKYQIMQSIMTWLLINNFWELNLENFPILQHGYFRGNYLLILYKNNLDTSKFKTSKECCRLKNFSYLYL